MKKTVKISDEALAEMIAAEQFADPIEEEDFFAQFLAFKELQMYRAQNAPLIVEADVLQSAVNTYGVDAQLLMVVEECAELQQAILKWFRVIDTPDNKAVDIAAEHVAEEAADVFVTLSQLLLVFDAESVQRHVDSKMQRLKERIEQV